MSNKRAGVVWGLALGLLSGQAALAQCLPFDFYCLLQGYEQGQSGSRADALPYGQTAPQWGNPNAGNPNAGNPPRILDQYGTYYGRYSTNPYLEDSIANPEGAFGPSGQGNPFGYNPGYSSGPGYGYSNGYTNAAPYGYNDGGRYGLQDQGSYGTPYGGQRGTSNLYDTLNRGAAGQRRFYLVPSED